MRTFYPAILSLFQILVRGWKLSTRGGSPSRCAPLSLSLVGRCCWPTCSATGAGLNKLPPEASPNSAPSYQGGLPRASWEVGAGSSTRSPLT